MLGAVNSELAELGISDRELARGGLQIVTTLDPLRQRQAVDAARGPLDGRSGNLRSAMVAIDPGTGGVLAYYGGDGGQAPDYARAPRLAGPTFTPFVMLAGLLHEPPVDPGQPIGVLARRVGSGAVADAARAAGIIPSTDHDVRRDQAHGDTAVSPYNLASAYATLAAGGVWRPPHLVAEVRTEDGRVLYRPEQRAEQRFDRSVARLVTETMVRSTDRTGSVLPGGRSVAVRAGAVGTSGRDDAWSAGFTPDLAASVWMGTDPEAPPTVDGGSAEPGLRRPGSVPAEARAAGSGASGARAPGSATSRSAGSALLPGKVWREFMTGALSGQPAPDEPTPAPSRPTGTPAPSSSATPTRPVPTAKPPRSTEPTAEPSAEPSGTSTEPADETSAEPTDERSAEPAAEATGESADP